MTPRALKPFVVAELVVNAREECADVAGRDRGDGAQLVLAQVARRARIELENHESVGSTSHTRPRAACASTTTHTAAFLEGIRMANEEDLKRGACSLSPV